MKKLEPPSTLHEQIEGVRVTRDDVDFIVELFRRDVADPTLSDDHFEFDSLTEFIEHRGTKPKKLEIESTTSDKSYRNISAKFEKNHVWLYGTRETPFYEAKEFLLTRRHWAFKALNPLPWLFVTILGGNIYTSFAKTAQEKHATVPEWPLCLLGISFFLMISGFVYRRFDFGLRLMRQHEGGFWTRNAEKIALTLIGAVIGSVITWLGKFLGAR